jgi:spore maturation protein CgeB
MKLVIFGLTISSSWGNGHATLWRGLCKGLARLGHEVVFFERDAPYYASNRDWHTMPHGELVLYDSWSTVAPRAQRELADADAAIVTSYCPDAVLAAEAICAAPRPVSAFYDLDTPVTLARLRSGERVPYVPAGGLAEFDLVLSYTGGSALAELESSLGAREAQPLYGHVDPDVHHRVAHVDRYRADLSYLGTYAADRQPALERLFLEPARRHLDRRFLIAGAQYPQDFPWVSSVYFVQHLPPCEHAAFFSSSKFTLNVTRAAMASMGWCPSGRLFEAAACATVLLTDSWPGLRDFYEPGDQLLIATDPESVSNALELTDEEIARIGRAAHERTLDEHTCHHRAQTLFELLASCNRSGRSRSFVSRTNSRATAHFSQLRN